MKTYGAKIAGLFRTSPEFMYQTHSDLFQKSAIDYSKCSKYFKKMIGGSP